VSLRFALLERERSTAERPQLELIGAALQAMKSLRSLHLLERYEAKRVRPPTALVGDLLIHLPSLTELHLSVPSSAAAALHFDAPLLGDLELYGVASITPTNLLRILDKTSCDSLAALFATGYLASLTKLHLDPVRIAAGEITSITRHFHVLTSLALQLERYGKELDLLQLLRDAPCLRFCKLRQKRTTTEAAIQRPEFTAVLIQASLEYLELLGIPLPEPSRYLKLPALKSLEVQYGSPRDDLASWLVAAPKLLSMRISDHASGTVEAFVSHEHLVQVVFSNCRAIRDTHIFRIALGAAQLRSMDLNSLPLVTADVDWLSAQFILNRRP